MGRMTFTECFVCLVSGKEATAPLTITTASELPSLTAELGAGAYFPGARPATAPERQPRPLS